MYSFSTSVTNSLELPLFNTRVQAGFPSPADDHLASRLDLNNHLIKNPSATFFVRAIGNSMLGAGIRENDLLLVDRSIKAKNGSIIIGVIEGEFTIKRLKIVGNDIYLITDNKNFSPVKVREDFYVWGVVTSVIHQFK